jgi:alpha-tubulin suppressor-like RCC1 family protein
VGTDTDWKAVFGNYSFFAIRTDGTLWAWGNNSAGDGIGSDILGVGSAEAVVTSPQQVGVDANWKTVLATAAGAVALKTDGSLWAWGWNRGWTGAGGVLGTASLADYIHAPEQVGTDSDWTGVYGGQGSVFFATKTDGSLWAWGQNEEGQLGVGYVSPVVTVPTPVAGEAVWVRVAVGYGGGGTLVLGLQLDGSLWEWGAKTQGNPQQLGTDRNWKKIGFRGESTVGRIPLAMKTDGSLWAWGYQTETSPGIFEEVTLPTLVASNVPWVGLPHYGPGSNVSLKTDGTLWQCAVMWDAGGGLGVVFTQVGQESDWAGFAGADLSFPGHCRLFKADGSLWRFENHPEEIGGEWVPDVAPVEVTTSVPWKR